MPSSPRLSILLVLLLCYLIPSGAHSPACDYSPSNVQGIVQHYVNFQDSALVIGNTPNGYKWLNCPCFTGIFQDGFLQTSTGEAGLLASNQAFLIPKAGEVQLSSTFKFYDQLKGSCNTTEIINMNENPFYGYGTLTAADWVSGWSFGFVLTNYKIYALYGRIPIHQDPYSTLYNFPFTYLVPIAPRWPAALYTFGLVMNAAKKSVSYRIDEKEKLYLEPVGEAIDRRFLVNPTVPDPSNCPEFPESFHILLGNSRLVASGPDREQVCQNAIFNQCNNSLHNALNSTVCQYNPIPQEPFGKEVLMTSVFYDVNVVQWNDAFNCREQDCRFDCRIPECPFESCGESSSSETSSSSSSTSSSSVDRCPGRHPISSSSSSARITRNRRAPTRFPCYEAEGTEFCFDPDWSN